MDERLFQQVYEPISLGSTEEAASCAPCGCDCAQLPCVCPGGEELHPWQQAEEHGADQHSQSGEREALPPCSELHQELSPDSPADQTERVSNCEEEPLPLQDGPDHAAPPQGAANHTHHHSAEAQRRPQRQIPEPCWYCMKSLTRDTLKKLQLDFESLRLPPKGKRFSYQQDPRPHFGVAHSARSTPFPLWGCEGPLRRERRLEDGDQMSACPHCYLALPLDTLQWHETKCLVFEGLKTSCGKEAK
ncbi:uncharacterized protein LOC118236211 [Anguilla anguilla]|uniref:uncharacterized protein LOC118236211 n=1 Tax=Anguilla anguilla TaxID=7936 RepID=UPI0015AB6E85|nr:uncharacterized protein LOC118236211 [Anguilla anguilla]